VEPTAPPVVRIEPWGADDGWLLERLNDPESTEHVGGPETEDELTERQATYEVAGSKQYRIVEGTGGDAVGWVGYWDRIWRDEPVWEVGWAVVRSARGRGVATAATALLLDHVRAEPRLLPVHAFPMVANEPSNAICRKLGFTLLGEIEIGGRRGGTVRCNDWRLDLSGEAEPAP
jgi:RimJ/RimL family protein N-acetyltransferase